jgi:cytochrome c oxidase cbb3-type subunit 3
MRGRGALTAGFALALVIAACRTFPPPPPGFSAAGFDAIAANPAWRDFALAQGALIFDDECALCHGDELQGKPGYPALDDDEWIWGDGVEEIAEVVRGGVRVEGEQRGTFAPGTRHGPDQAPPVVMLPLEDELAREEIEQLSRYTEWLIAQQRAPAPAAGAPPGAALFATACGACHGASGEGRPTMGWPRLRGENSQIEARDAREIAREIRKGAEAETMDAFAEDLSEDEIRCVAFFVRARSRPSRPADSAGPAER